MKENKIYLPGLNGIRAIAAISVIISHIGIHLDYYGFKNIKAYSLANYGVTMFFALSGFLITYLLLAEKKNSGVINLKFFYIRRILRIWPLYFFYMIVALIFLYLINEKVGINILYYFLMIPNYPFAINSATGIAATVLFIGHYWSVGVEEQFYSFWPFLIKKSKNIFVALSIFFISFMIVKIILSSMHANPTIITFFQITRFGCLTLGGIVAYLYFYKHKIISYLKNPIIEASAWIVFLLVAINKYDLLNVIEHEIFSFFTLIIIINQIDNPKKLISLENKVFDYLGKISYGLYIYNPLMIFLMSFGIKEILTSNQYINFVLIYSITIISIIIISHLSYFYFETMFLKFKNKFMIVESKSSAS